MQDNNDIANKSIEHMQDNNDTTKNNIEHMQKKDDTTKKMKICRKALELCRKTSHPLCF